MVILQLSVLYGVYMYVLNTYPDIHTHIQCDTHLKMSHFDSLAMYMWMLHGAVIL